MIPSKWGRGSASASGSGILVNNSSDALSDPKLKEPTAPKRSRTHESDKHFVPRAIYNDPVQELLLREEAANSARGRSRRRAASEELLRPLKKTNSYLPQFSDSLAYSKPPSVKTDAPKNPTISEATDSDDESEEETEQRTVILTEIGVDIMMEKRKPPAPPLPKAALRNPSDMPVYNPARHKALPPVFDSTVRAATWKNTLSVYDDKQTDQAFKTTQAMIDAQTNFAKSLTLRYSKPLEPEKRPKHRRAGLSFRGRGKLECRRIQELAEELTVEKPKPKNMSEKIYPPARGRSNASAVAAGTGGVQKQKKLDNEVQNSQQSLKPKRDGQSLKSEEILSTRLKASHDSVGRSEASVRVSSNSVKDHSLRNSSSSVSKPATSGSLYESENSIEGGREIEKDDEPESVEVEDNVVDESKAGNHLSVAIGGNVSISTDSLALSPGTEDAWLEEERKALYASWGRQVPEVKEEEEPEQPPKHEKIAEQTAAEVKQEASVTKADSSSNVPRSFSQDHNHLVPDVPEKVISDGNKIQKEPTSLVEERTEAIMPVAKPVLASRQLLESLAAASKSAADTPAPAPAPAPEVAAVATTEEATLSIPPPQQRQEKETIAEPAPVFEMYESSAALKVVTDVELDEDSEVSPTVDSPSELKDKKSAKSKALKGLKKLASPLSKMFQSKEGLLASANSSKANIIIASDNETANEAKPGDRRDSTSSRMSRSSRVSRMSRSSINVDRESPNQEATSADSKKSFGSLRSLKDATKAMMGRSGSNTNVSHIRRGSDGAEESAGEAESPSPSKSHFSLKNLKAKSISSLRSFKSKAKSGSRDVLQTSDDILAEDPVELPEEEEKEDFETHQEDIKAALPLKDESRLQEERTPAAISNQTHKESSNATIPTEVVKAVVQEKEAGKSLELALKEEEIKRAREFDALLNALTTATVTGSVNRIEDSAVKEPPILSDILPPIADQKDTPIPTEKPIEIKQEKNILERPKITEDVKPTISETDRILTPDSAAEKKLVDVQKNESLKDLIPKAKPTVSQNIPTASTEENPRPSEEAKMPKTEEKNPTETNSVNKLKEALASKAVEKSVESLKPSRLEEKDSVSKKHIAVSDKPATQSKAASSNESEKVEKISKSEDAKVEPVTTASALSLAKTQEKVDVQKSDPSLSESVKPQPKSEDVVKTEDVGVFANSRPLPRVAMFMNAMDVNSIKAPSKPPPPELLKASAESIDKKGSLDKLQKAASPTASQTLYTSPGEKEKARRKELAERSNQELNETTEQEPTETGHASGAVVAPEKPNASASALPKPPTNTTQPTAAASSASLAPVSAASNVEKKAEVAPKPAAIPQSISLKASMKGVKVDVKFENFELNCLEKGKPAKHFFPVESRRIVKAQQDSDSEVTIFACVTRKKKMAGSKLKKLKFQLDDASQTKQFVEVIMNAVYGTTILEPHVTRNVLVLIDKFDNKDMAKQIEKHMKPILDDSNNEKSIYLLKQILWMQLLEY
ncbi:hypothetical protein HDU97_005030 [Phlyctochytrium planicorne]|nr:hypothetical protein HDU97_005030 [Phlyctochytrium planicorne]